MEKVALGTRVNRLGIPRVSCAEGSKCRVVLLDMNPRMKHVAFDEEIRRSVEVDQDMCIKFGLRPSPTFYYLVAKLNTDLAGHVVGSTFTVEYLQLSETQNNEFADAVSEQGIPKSLMLTKLKKTNEQGKDMSVTKVTTSNYDPLAEDKNLAAKIEAVRNNTELIENSWKMIDATTTIAKLTYFKLKNMDDEVKRLEAQESNKAAGIENRPQSQIQAPKAPATAIESSNDFSGANDFGDGDLAEGFDN